MLQQRCSFNDESVEILHQNLHISTEPGTTVCKTKDGTTLQDGGSIKYPEKCEECACNSNILSCCGFVFLCFSCHKKRPRET